MWLRCLQGGSGDRIFTKQAWANFVHACFHSVFLLFQHVDLYLGSMNATYSAANKNVEMMIWLRTKNRYYNGEMFLQDLFCGKADNPHNPFELSEVTALVSDIQQEATGKEHLLVQLGDLVRDVVGRATTDILNRFAKTVASLEGNDFIGTIDANFVVDALPDVLGLLQDRCLAAIIIPQILDLTLVDRVVTQRQTEHIHHVFGRDCFHVSINLSSPK